MSLPKSKSQKARELLTPNVFQAKPNQNIIIYDGAMDLVTDSYTISGRGTIEFIWLPQQTIHVKFNYEREHHKSPSIDTQFNISVNNIGKRFPFRPSRYSVGFYEGEIAFYEEGDRTLLFDEITFEVPNLLQFHCVGESTDPIPDNCHSLFFPNSDLDLELQNPERKDNYLGIDGGYVLNGRGKIKFKDRKRSFEEVLEVMKLLGAFLTFVHGRKLSPIFIHAKAEQKPVFKFYRATLIEENSLPWAWFHPRINTRYDYSIDKLWASFLTFGKNEDDKDWLLMLIHWYIEAMALRSGGEASLILVQNALELLSSVVLVEKEAIIDRSDYDKISTATLINILLSWGNISNKIPTSFKELTSVAKENNITTGPNIITYVRNSIVHPHQKNRRKFRFLSHSAKHHALQLALHYVELITLKVLNYQGTYSNRCSDKQYFDSFQKVPWAIQNESP